MPKSDFLGHILSTSGPKARKCRNRTSWDPFCRLLDPRPENAKIRPPGNHFVDFWTQGQKMLKSDFLGPILSTSGPEARKCQNRASWDPVYRVLEPRPENAKIGTGTQHPSETRVMKTFIETFQFIFGVDAGVIDIFIFHFHFLLYGLLIGGWGVLNREIVSFRSCVRTRGLVA